ncbi:MAG: DUF4280 domain-containing protein, partial [Limnohabitans sp.]|nr:DUF4280 domain-containing protein [Limnohabitans sp.]
SLQSQFTVYSLQFTVAVYREHYTIYRLQITDSNNKLEINKLTKNKKMSEKHVVVDGATVKCIFSVEPKTDKLKVKSHSKHTANDKEGNTKYIATDKEIGQTLEKNTFGKCKKQPNGSGDFLVCQCIVHKWSKFYEKTTLSNGGKILTEESKATCPMGAPDCITIDDHGQKTQGSKQNDKNTTPKKQKAINPIANTHRKRTHKGVETAVIEKQKSN